MAAIEFRNVSYTYLKSVKGAKKALDGIDISIDGGITGLIGHTGCGKSTLVQMINGLLRPDEGQVLIDGVDIWKEPKKIGEIRFKAGLVMQYPEYQLFEETVRKDIAYGPTRMRLSAEETEARVRESAAIVGLSDTELDASPFELSGGQKRRAAIAGILAMRPEVLVLDEPAAGLDPEGRDVIFSAVRRYKEEQGATVILVSHSMENLTEYCDRIAVLKKGKLELSGTREEIFSDPKVLRASGLDVPEITVLAEELAERGLSLDRPVYSVGGAAEAVSVLLGKRKGGNA